MLGTKSKNQESTDEYNPSKAIGNNFYKKQLAQDYLPAQRPPPGKIGLGTQASENGSHTILERVHKINSKRTWVMPWQAIAQEQLYGLCPLGHPASGKCKIIRGSSRARIARSCRNLLKHAA